MNLGDIFLWLTGLSVLIAAWFYWRAGEIESRLRIANRLVRVHAILLTHAMILLLYYFLSNRFRYDYVTHNSSRDLPLFYKISALWAGQEGTFLLWAWMAALMLLFVIRRRGELLRVTMLYLLATQLFLLILLFVRSPFAHVPDGVVPADGNGLNPLLKDPWMVIHPPIVFIGYAAFAIPFCYTLAALTLKRYASLAATIFPWVAFAVTTLGAGIFIGGFWAYKVLGWGGYWGWDPVENASLVPWLVGLALVHALLLFRARGQLAKTSILLSIAAYVLVVYGTFLTRSGVLADFSVHSFTDTGINVYLTVYLIAVTAAPLILWFLRRRSIISPAISTLVNSREFGIVSGILLLGLLAAFVLVGTSAPILTAIGGTPANVATTYYNTMALPFGILIALVLGFSPFLLFERIPWSELFKATMFSFLAAGIVTIVIVLLTNVSLIHATLVFMAILALVSNLVAMIRFSGGRPTRLAGHLTHLGYAVLVIGIIGSGAYSAEERLTIKRGEHQSAFGHQIDFRGLVEAERAEDGYLDLVVSKNGDSSWARAKLYVSEYTQQTMRAPFVKRSVFSDLYVAPLDHRRSHRQDDLFTLAKGSTDRYADWDLTFDRFEIGDHAQAGAMRVGAVITAVRGRDTVVFVPALETGPGGQHPFPTLLPGTNLTFSLVGMSVENRQIALKIDDPDSPAHGAADEMVVLAVSRKPLTNFVWAGCVIITLGGGLSYWRRRRELALTGEISSEPVIQPPPPPVPMSRMVR